MVRHSALRRPKTLVGGDNVRHLPLRLWNRIQTGGMCPSQSGMSRPSKQTSMQGISKAPPIICCSMLAKLRLTHLVCQR